MDASEATSSMRNALETQLKRIRPNFWKDSAKKPEKKLGTETAEDRLIEAGLFIDQKFINVAIITGNTQNPERMFGDDAWMDYVEARKAAKEYGGKDLTPDFIINLQKKLTRYSNRKVSGKIRDAVVRAADYNDPREPVTYSQEQLKAILANPYLSFKRATRESEGNTTGFIFYPKPEDIAEKLRELCIWFNNAKREENYDPFKIAALLQQRLISIHPFEDANGTLSRLLMNWSLENDGELPSILANPNDDILTEGEEWVSEVKNGSKKLFEIKKRQLRMKNAGIEDIPALFGLEQEQAFYEYVFKHISNAPLLVFKGGKLDHKEYEAFVESFTQEFKLFESLIRAHSTVNIGKSTRTLSHGGLISEEFMKLAGLKTSNPNPELEGFFSDVDVYRGGLCEDKLTDAKICAMFMHYIGVGTGYRAVGKSGVNATSARQINPEQIKEAMEYYNKMVAAFFFKSKHPDKKNPYADDPAIKDLKTTITGHVSGGDSVWNSPFASTSIDINVSRQWARAREGENGILFKAKAPKEGILLSFGPDLPSIGKGFHFEREALIAGGVQPSSVYEIEIYDSNVRDGSDPAIIAKRAEIDGVKGIELEDRKGDFVVKRFYVLNIQSGSFELAAEEQTSIPVKRIVAAEISYKSKSADYTWTVTELIAQIEGNIGINQLKTDYNLFSGLKKLYGNYDEKNIAKDIFIPTKEKFSYSPIPSIKIKDEKNK